MRPPTSGSADTTRFVPRHAASSSSAAVSGSGGGGEAAFHVALSTGSGFVTGGRRIAGRPGPHTFPVGPRVEARVRETWPKVRVRRGRRRRRPGPGRRERGSERRQPTHRERTRISSSPSATSSGAYARLRTAMGMAKAPYRTSGGAIRASRSAVTPSHRVPTRNCRARTGDTARAAASSLKRHVCALQVLLTCTDEMGHVDPHDGSRRSTRWGTCTR
jgi:hypothetical protein